MKELVELKKQNGIEPAEDVRKSALAPYSILKPVYSEILLNIAV